MQTQKLAATVAEIEELTVQLGWVMHRRQSYRLKQFNLTLPQLMTMRTIHRAGGPCSMSLIAETSMQASATITGIVDRLEERGLVQRQPDPVDRRCLRVSLTAAGEQRLQQIESRKRQRLSDYLEQLPPGQQSALLDLMRSYVQALAEEKDE